MSASYMPEETVEIIATYLARSANIHMGMNVGLMKVQPDHHFRMYLTQTCYDSKRGEISPAKVYDLLFEFNYKAVKASHGVTDKFIRGYQEHGILKDEKNRREWESNLYTVCTCYLYQISEDEVMETQFYKHFKNWVDMMADQLAMFTVEEFRRTNTPTPKTWFEF